MLIALPPLLCRPPARCVLKLNNLALQGGGGGGFLIHGSVHHLHCLPHASSVRPPRTRSGMGPHVTVGEGGGWSALSLICAATAGSMAGSPLRPWMTGAPGARPPPSSARVQWKGYCAVRARARHV